VLGLIGVGLAPVSAAFEEATTLQTEPAAVLACGTLSTPRKFNELSRVGYSSYITPATAEVLECARVAQVGPGGDMAHRTEFNREFKLRNGAAARIGNEGLELRFERVVADGRCPVGDPCLSDPGDAVVVVTVQQPAHERAVLELHTHPALRPTGQYFGYLIRLVRLEPRPVGEQPVPLPQYSGTFVVSR
jgi:hypothetical protein